MDFVHPQYGIIELRCIQGALLPQPGCGRARFGAGGRGRRARCFRAKGSAEFGSGGAAGAPEAAAQWPALDKGGRARQVALGLFGISLPEFMNFKLFGFGPFWWQIYSLNFFWAIHSASEGMGSLDWTTCLVETSGSSVDRYGTDAGAHPRGFSLQMASVWPRLMISSQGSSQGRTI